MANAERTAQVVWSGTIARGTGMASGGSGALRDFRSHSRRDLATPRGRPARKS
jgi:hypothetical protein